MKELFSIYHTWVYINKLKLYLLSLILASHNLIDSQIICFLQHNFHATFLKIALTDLQFSPVIPLKFCILFYRHPLEIPSEFISSH